MTALACKDEKVEQELDAAKQSLKERGRTRRQLDKVLQDAAFAVRSMLTVTVDFLLTYLNSWLSRHKGSHTAQSQADIFAIYCRQTAV